MKKSNEKVNRMCDRPRNQWLPPVVLALAALVLSAPFVHAGDWPAYMHDNHRSGVTSEQLDLPLSQAWVRDTHRPAAPAWNETPALHNFWGGTYGHRSRVSYDMTYHVAVVGDSLYYGSSNSDKIVCLDAGTGAVNWQYFTGGPVRFAPAVDGGNVYAGSDDGYVYCLDAANGTKLWSTRATSSNDLMFINGRMSSVAPVRTSVLVEGGTVYWAAGMFQGAKTGLSRYLCARNAANGTGGWTTTPSAPPQGYLLSASDNLFVPSGKRPPRLYNQSSGGGGSEVGVTGCYALIIDNSLANGPAYSGDSSYINAPVIGQVEGNCLVVSGNYAYYCNDTQLIKLQRSPKVTQWTVASPYRYSLILAGTTLFAGGDNEVAAFDIANGNQTWSAPVSGRAYGLAVANGGLYVSTDTGNIHAFGNFEPADINNDGFINALDLAEMSSQWKDCTNPNDVNCRDVTQ
jgi:outer membrane protein assembly factor BamB